MKVKDFLGNEWKIDCMGCAIGKGTMQVPGGFIQRTPHFCVHQDPLVPIAGFSVIASKRHIRSISEMHDVEYEELSRLMRDVLLAIKKATSVEELTLVQEERSAHFHLWFFPWTQEIIGRYGEPSLTKIREIMMEYRARPIDPSEWKELETVINRMRAQIEGG